MHSSDIRSKIIESDEEDVAVDLRGAVHNLLWDEDPYGCRAPTGRLDGVDRFTKDDRPRDREATCPSSRSTVPSTDAS